MGISVASPASSPPAIWPFLPVRGRLRTKLARNRALYGLAEPCVAALLEEVNALAGAR